MESISIFDIFKIGVGPSSSHTLGPWKAAQHFIGSLALQKVDKIQVHLYGSLSKTGLGHATDKAIILGLLDYSPITIDTDSIDDIIVEVRALNLLKTKKKDISFHYEQDLIFEPFEHQLHPNTLLFKAFSDKVVIKEQLFASVGGGFIESDHEIESSDKEIKFPFPINTGADISRYTTEENCSISEIVYHNELAIQSAESIDKKVEQLIETILESIYQGCTTEGILPGGLNVTRRAKAICSKLTNQAEFINRKEWLKLIKQSSKDFSSVNKWVSCFALAVNEQNAAMNRIVTSPTNGAAGVIPAVLMYYLIFCDYQGRESMKRFLFTAGEIGCLFKKGATISAAVGGCQAEIGVSAAMAAGGLTEMLGGTADQCLMAAEIAMEHHLGLTCDPIKGLVQVPCIERNAMGAMKAITACNLALESDAVKAIVNLDTVIKTMWEVAQNMNNIYKETSEGGLAINLPVINPNC